MIRSSRSSLARQQEGTRRGKRAQTNTSSQIYFALTQGLSHTLTIPLFSQKTHAMTGQEENPGEQLVRLQKWPMGHAGESLYTTTVQTGSKGQGNLQRQCSCFVESDSLIRHPDKTLGCFMKSPQWLQGRGAQYYQPYIHKGVTIV